MATMTRSRHQRVQAHDPVLIERCLNDDSAAWEELVAKYAQTVYSVPLRYELPEADAEEVFHRVWSITLEELARLARMDTIANWLVKTASRESWDRIHRRGGARPDTGSLADLRDSRDEARLADEAIAAIEEQRVVRDAMDTMGDLCRQVLWFTYYDPASSSVTEIAARLGLSEQEVNLRRATCLLKLKQKLESGGWAAAPARGPSSISAGLT